MVPLVPAVPVVINGGVNRVRGRGSWGLHGRSLRELACFENRNVEMTRRTERPLRTTLPAGVPPA